ncbi:hypothetical protein Tco_0949772 [Tanacetum coccineum]
MASSSPTSSSTNGDNLVGRGLSSNVTLSDSSTFTCMRTRSQSRNLNRQQQQAPPDFVEPFDLEEPIENPAPPVGYEDAIVVPEITADNFELKHDHFYDEVPERPEYVGKAYAFPIFPRGCLERISKKRTKNKAKMTKLDMEWKSVEKTKSRQSPSVKKSTKVNTDKSKVKK